MSFLNAGIAAAGLLAISIPILIHLLFRQRKRPVEWGAMRLLLEAWRRSRRRLRLEQWLLLAVRCLVIGLIGLALGRPIVDLAADALGSGLLAGGRSVYIVIDNGIVASTTPQDTGISTGTVGSALDRQKLAAFEIVGALEPSDRVAVISLARPIGSPTAPPTLDHATVIRSIDAIEASDAPTDLSQGLQRVAEALEAERPSASGAAFVYLLSEFRAGSTSLDRTVTATPEGDPSAPDTPAEGNGTDDPATGLLARAAGPGRTLILLAAAPASDQIENVQIVDVRPVRSVTVAGGADGADQVAILLRRTGDLANARTTTVRLAATGLREIDPVSLRWSPGQSEAHPVARVPLSLAEPGTYVIEASIDDDALLRDNRFARVIEVRPSLRVAILDRPEFRSVATGRMDAFSSAQWIRRALAPAEGTPIETNDVDPTALSVGSLRNVAAAVLTRPDLVSETGWQTLEAFVDRGGLLWIMPSDDTDVALWTDPAMERLGLPWRFAREPIDTSSVAERTPVSSGERADATGSDIAGWAIDAGDNTVGTLLLMLSSELPELLSTVTVNRVLPLEPGTVAADEVMLRLDRNLFAGDRAADEPLSTVAGRSGPAAGPPPTSPTSEGTPFLVAASPPGARGLVVYLGSSLRLDWTTLAAKPVIIALAQEIVRQGLGAIRSREDLRAGTTPLLTPAPGAVAIVDPSGDRIPLTTPEGNTDGAMNDNAAATSVRRPTRPLGVAGVYAEVSTADEPLGRFAVNIVPDAARTEVTNRTALAQWLAPSGQWRFVQMATSDPASGMPPNATVGTGSSRAGEPGGAAPNTDAPLTAALTDEGPRSDLSYMLLLLALVFALIETGLARWFSHARRATGVSSSGSILQSTGMRRSGGGGSTAGRGVSGPLVDRGGGGGGTFSDGDVGAPIASGRSSDGRDVPDLDRYVVQPSGHPAAPEESSWDRSRTRAPGRGPGSGRGEGGR